MGADLDVHADLDLNVTLGHVAEVISKHNRNMALRAKIAPRTVSFRAGAVCPTPTAPFVIGMNDIGPAAGRMWHVMAVAVMGSAGATTAPAGTCYSYIGPVGAITSAADVAGGWVDKTSTAFPVTAFYGQWQFAFTWPDNAYFLISGGTAGTYYSVYGRAVDAPDYGSGRIVFEE